MSAEEKARLESLLKNRADAKELQDKNILKGESQLILVGGQAAGR